MVTLSSYAVWSVPTMARQVRSTVARRQPGDGGGRMIYVFGDYTLDTERYELRHAGELCKLEPQAFNVLAYLLEHRARVVTKEELLARLWPNQFVSEVTVNHGVMAARRAIGDSGQAQRCIKTLHGRGYRFIAEVTMVGQPLVDVPTSTPASSFMPTTGTGLSLRSPGVCVAREAEFAVLRQSLTMALHGQRQVVFLAGEAGIGKTTLVDAFVTDMAPATAWWVGRGQCIDQYGAGEAYLPLLEALGQWCRAAEGAQLVALLHQQAPHWLLQMPACLSPTEYDDLQRRCSGTTRDRMLRELAEALETLTAQRPLILILEDPHSTRFSGKEYHCSSKASRREDLQVEEPVSCWDCASFDFHPTLASVLGSTLIGHALPDATDKKDPVSPQARSLVPGIPEGY